MAVQRNLKHTVTCACQFVGALGQTYRIHIFLQRPACLMLENTVGMAPGISGCPAYLFRGKAVLLKMFLYIILHASYCLNFIHTMLYPLLHHHTVSIRNLS